MKYITRLVSDPRLIVPTGVALAVSFLLLDAIVDSIFFDEAGRGFVENLVKPEPMDLWMRLVVAVFMIGFAFHARLLLRRQAAVAAELAAQKALLEERVAEATRGLRERNDALHLEIDARRKAEAELEKLAATDALTQLHNRRKLLEALHQCIDLYRRYGTGLSVIICDIDHFKQINDGHGHDVGDSVLREFADVLRRNTRSSDTAARWGGEEFAILTPLADGEQALALAEKLRLAIEQSDFSRGLRVTASFGIAALQRDETAEMAMKRADQALYAAKDGGRNRVVLAA